MLSWAWCSNPSTGSASFSTFLTVDLALHFHPCTDSILFLTCGGVVCVVFFLTQKTEGWILPLLTAEQQFYTQKPFFSLDSGAQNLMHCKSHPLLPFPPPPLFCILFCDIFFLYLSIFKENLCIFHLQKYYQIYAAIYTPYTYKSEDPYCSLRKWLCTVKSLPFLTPGKLIKTCYTASHD